MITEDRLLIEVVPYDVIIIIFLLCLVDRLLIDVMPCMIMIIIVPALSYMVLLLLLLLLPSVFDRSQLPSFFRGEEC